jgi:DNA-binding transcriptional LysR family regulator
MTSAGQAISQQCTAMESAALGIEGAAAGRDSLVTGSVRVTTTEAPAYLLVGPVIAALRQTHPDLQIDLTVGVRSLDIARRESDLAIRFARPAASELVCRKLGEVGFSLYASQRYLAKLGIPKTRPWIGWLRPPHLHGRTRRHESVFHGRIVGRCARRDPPRYDISQFGT